MQAAEAASTSTQPDVLSEETRSSALTLPEQAALISIDTSAEFEFAGEWIRDVVIPLHEQIRATFRPHISRAHELHRMLIADEKRFLEPVERAELAVKRTMAGYHERVERERQAAERRAREERERRERQATIERGVYLAAVAIAQVGELKLERDEIEAAARRAEKAGDSEAAEALRDEAQRVEPTIQPEPAPLFVEPTPISAAPEPPRVDGTSVRALWRAEVTDFPALVRYVAQHPEHMGLLKPDQSALDRLAKALREGLRSIPGVRPVKESSVAVRRR